MATTAKKTAARKKPQDRQSKRVTPKTKKAVSTAEEWKKSGSTDHDIEVPSGNVAKVRRKPMDALMAAGIIPNSLMPIVQEALQSGKEPDLNPEELTADQMEGVLQLVDGVVVSCTLQPHVSPIPADEADRDESKLYVDEVLMKDKMFIFQFVVGGTADVESFREEQGQRLEPVPASEDVAGDAL